MAENHTKPPNDRLRRVRESLPSPHGAGRPMSRRELAEAASRYLERPIDTKYVAKLERGVHRWPSRSTRDALRRALGAADDHDLGFYVDRPSRSTAGATTKPSVVPYAVVHDRADAVLPALITHADESARDRIAGLFAHEPRLRVALARRDITRVYQILQRHGVTQRQIGALTGRSQADVNAITQGRRVISYDLLTRIVDGLGVPRGWVGLAYDDETAGVLVAAELPEHQSLGAGGVSLGAQP